MSDNISNKRPYVDRDISWMYFNRRILQEAMRPEVPALERLSFLGIYSSNLDEFFRVRMATISRIAGIKGRQLKAEQSMAKKLFRRLTAIDVEYAATYQQAINEVIADLKADNNRLMVTPADGRAFNVFVGGAQRVDATIYSIAGLPVASQSAEADELTIDASALPAGCYILTANGQSQKIIVK